MFGNHVLNSFWLCEGTPFLTPASCNLLRHKAAGGLVDLAIPPLLQPLVASAPNVLHGKFCGAALLHRNWASAQIGPFGDVVRDNLEQQNIAALDVAAQPVYSAAVRREL